MNVLRKIIVFSLFIAIGALMWSSPVLAGVSCHRINAKGVGQDMGNGMTQAQIQGGGLLKGTTTAQFVITGLQGNEASFEGPVTFTTNRATLTVTIIGTFNVVSGAFLASGPVTDATGKLAGATGSLSFDGVQNLVDGSFVEKVTGQLCVNLSP